MVNMNVLETSGVDHPAHGFEGWLVRKSADPQKVAELRALLRKDSAMAVTKSDLIAEIRKSAADPIVQEAMVKAVDLAKDVKAAAALWSSLRAKLEQDDPATPSIDEDDEGDPVTTTAPPADAAGAASADLFKSVTDPVAREFLRKQAEENVTLRKVADEALAKAAEERGIRLDREAIAMSKSTYGQIAMDHDVVAPALRKLATEDPDTYATIVKALDGANGQLDAANIFGQIGTSRSAVSGTGAAMAKATALAEGYVAAGVAANIDQGMAKAWGDNPSLYAEYEKENV